MDGGGRAQRQSSALRTLCRRRSVILRSTGAAPSGLEHRPERSPPQSATLVDTMTTEYRIWQQVRRVASHQGSKEELIANHAVAHSEGVTAATTVCGRPLDDEAGRMSHLPFGPDLVLDGCPACGSALGVDTTWS